MPTKHGPKVNAFYHSAQWKQTRRDYYLSKKGICEICGRKGNIVHHKIPLNEKNVSNPMISLAWSNLQVVCYECHRSIHADMENGEENRPTVISFGPDGKTTVQAKEGGKNNGK